MHMFLVSNADVKSTDYCTFDTRLVSEIVVLDTGLNDTAYYHTLQTSLSHCYYLLVFLEQSERLRRNAEAATVSRVQVLCCWFYSLR